MSQGKYEQAEPVLREAVRLVEQDRRLKHSYLMAIALNNLAAVLCHAKKFEESEALSKRAPFYLRTKERSNLWICICAAQPGFDLRADRSFS